MEILSVRAKNNYSGIEGGFDAEATVVDSGERYYVHCHFSDEKRISVSKTSFYDYIAGNGDDPGDIEFIEYYEGSDLDNVGDSLFASAIEIVDYLVCKMS